MNHDERIEAHIAQQLVNEACDQIAAEIKDGITPERICHECLSMFSIFVWVPHGNVRYSEEVGSVFFECDECRFPEEGDDFCSDCGNPFFECPCDDEDSDGEYASWLCASCGDPAYDCGCDDSPLSDIDDEIDRMAQLIKNGRL